MTTTLAPRGATVIFSTSSRLNQRGIRARAKSWGWSWVKGAEGEGIHFTSIAEPERMRAPRHPRHRHLVHRACAVCGYAEAATIGEDEPVTCPACQLDAVAIRALAFAEISGDVMGWKMPELSKRRELLELFHRGDSGMTVVKVRLERRGKKRE